MYYRGGALTLGFWPIFKPTGLQVCRFLFAARAIGHETGVQVPRHVGFVHGQDVLDEVAHVPFGGREPKGPVRRRVPRNARQLWWAASAQDQGSDVKQT